MLPLPGDEKDERARMEASENKGLPPRRGGGAGLHRIDPARVAHTLGSGEHRTGYARLEVMLNSVLPRLVNEARASGEPRP
jgi:hypothetical protein